MSDAITLFFQSVTFQMLHCFGQWVPMLRDPTRSVELSKYCFRLLSSLGCQLWKLIFYVEGASLKGLMIVQRDSYSDQDIFTLFSRNLKWKVLFFAVVV